MRRWINWFLKKEKYSPPYFRYVEREAYLISKLIDACKKNQDLYYVFDLIEDFKAKCGCNIMCKSWYDSLILKWNNHFKKINDE